MLILAHRFKDMPVMSLQTGAEIASIAGEIINPQILEVIAYHVSGSRLEEEGMLLLTRDIREVGDVGVIVDSADELMSEDDLLNVKKVIKLNFKLIGLEAVDDLKQKLGKVYDYTIDPVTFTIHQLYIRRPLLRSLKTSDLVINRKQIIELNNKTVTVHSASLQEKIAPAMVPGSFVNPFRDLPRPAENTAETKS